MFLFGELIKSPFIHLLASYSSANHLTLHPSIPLASYFMPSISLASYFRADHLTFHPSIPLESYFCVVHSLGELFSYRPFNSPSLGEFFLCRPYNSPSVHRFGELYFRADHSIVLSVYPFGELFLCRPSLGESYFHANNLILHPLASYFNVYHITLHPSIPFNGGSRQNVDRVSSLKNLTKK